MSPTQRTLKHLRDAGYPLVQVVERWNPHARIRQDLFGIVDVLAVGRAVFLELLAETQELRFTSGEAVDVGSYTQALNSLLGVYRVLGVERKAKATKSLRDHLRAVS